MKRIIALILSVTMLLGLFTLQATADSTELSKAEEFAMGLGVVDADDYKADSILSRAEFAEIIASICKLTDENKNYEEWKEYVFGQDNSDELLTEPVESLFADVDSSLPQYDAICIVYKRGYMKGITDTHFAPNYDITVGAVVKVIVSMLGYEALAEAKGGYPMGYMLVGGNLGITSGLGVTVNDFATYGQTVKIIYNALDVNVVDVASVDTEKINYTESEDTFLYRCLGLTRIRARVEDNGLTTFYGKSRVGVKKIVIGGVEMLIGDCDYARGFIGREVEAYYRTGDGDDHTLAYARVNDADDCVSFDAQDFISYTGSGLKYASENGSVKSVSLDSNAKLFYNNLALDEYDASIFDFTYGDVTLISTDGGGYDIVVIRDYMVGKIIKKTTDTDCVYCDTLYEDMSLIKSLDCMEKGDKSVFIKNSDGAAITFADLAAGDVISVLMSADGSCVDITVSKTVIADYVIKGYSTDGDMELTDGATSYFIKEASEFAEALVFKSGEAYDLYFDFAGNLVWVEAASGNTGMKKGVLCATACDAKGLSREYMVRIYDETGKLSVMQLDDRILFNHSRKDTEDVFSQLENAVEDVILYKTDSDSKKISKIVLPLSYGAEDTDDRGWYSVSPKIKLSRTTESDDEWSAYRSNNLYMYQSNGYTLDKFMIYNRSAAKLFTVPESRSEFSEEKKFSLSNSFATDKGYLVNAYSSDAKAVAPEVMVMSSSTLTGGDVPNTSAFLVEQIVKGVDSDGAEVTQLRGYVMDFYKKSSVEATLNADNDTTFYDAETDQALNSGSTVLDPDNTSVADNGPRVISELSEGDIIRYSLNSGGNVGTIRVCYDYDKDKSFVFGSGDQAHISVGYPLYIRGEYARISPERPENVDLTDPAKARETIAQNIVPGSIMVVYKIGDKIKIKHGTLDDIVTYEESGTLAEYNKLAVVTFWYGFTCGTVVYK